MNSFESSCNREAFVRGILLLPALAGFATAGASADGSKASKASMHYQDKPSGDSQCSKCKFFNPGQTAAADGTCNIVDGTISPSGYCIAYNPK